MSVAAAAAADQPDPSIGPSFLSIGEVLARLRESFPDVTISKLRFLEAEGLVDPQRTSAGYRKYSPDDVERLEYVLAAQRDRFLPLRVIRDHLASLDRGEAVTVTDYQLSGGVSGGGSADGPEGAAGGAADGAAGSAPGHPPLTRPPLTRPSITRPSITRVDERPDRGDAAPSARMHRDEFLARSGLTDTSLTELEESGLVTARTPGWYDADALMIAAAAAGLAQHGIGVRHLRAYRSTADREAGLFAALVAPLAKSASPAARLRAADTIRELTELTHQLHGALLRISLRKTLGQ